MADTATYEQELADYLQGRIKPGLNSGAIPLLARSIAHDLAQRAVPQDASGNGAQADGGGSGSGGEGGELPDFETEMHELQSELGEDWIVRFSVQGKDEWLTAEKDDGTQRIEAETADVLIEAVGLLKERGRSS